MARIRQGPGWLSGMVRYLGLLVFFGVWQIISAFVLPRIDANLVSLMPPPTEVVKAAIALLVSGELLKHFLTSLQREVIAFTYACIAIPLGVLMGWSKTVQNLMEPVFEMLRPIPPIAWIPLAILWFGISDLQNQFIIFLGIFFPLLINTITGVKNVEYNIVRAARCLGASERAVLVRSCFGQHCRRS